MVHEKAKSIEGTESPVTTRGFQRVGAIFSTDPTHFSVRVGLKMDRALKSGPTHFIIYLGTYRILYSAIL